MSAAWQIETCIWIVVFILALGFVATMKAQR